MAGRMGEYISLIVAHLRMNNLLQKVLFALFVASIVGFSETILYIIWQSRHTNKANKKIKVMTMHKKTDAEYDDNDHLDEGTGIRDNVQDVGGQMRRRAGRQSEE